MKQAIVALLVLLSVIGFARTGMAGRQGPSAPQSVIISANAHADYPGLGSPRIPSTVFGANIDLGGMSPAYSLAQPPTQATQSLDQAGLKLMRVFVEQPYIVTADMTATTDYHLYDWTNFDRMVTYFKANGWQPLICLWQSAAYNSPPGTNGDTSAPLSAKEWGRVSANIVRHANIDMHFNIRYWEIWNEPDVQESYANSMTPTQYVNLFAAAAPQMLAVDPHILVGGPALSGHYAPGYAQTWLDPLLTNKTVQRTLRFVSWHTYDSPYETGSLIDLTRSILRQDDLRHRVLIFGPDEYRPYDSFDNLDYRGATGTAVYLTQMAQHGGAVGANWVAYSLALTDPDQFTLPWTNLVTTTTLQLIPQGYDYQMFTQKLAFAGKKVVWSVSSSPQFSVLAGVSDAASRQPVGQMALALTNDQSSQASVAGLLQLPHSGRYLMQEFVIGNDANGDGTGAGLNDQQVLTTTVATTVKGLLNLSLTIQPYTVTGLLLTPRK